MITLAVPAWDDPVTCPPNVAHAGRVLFTPRPGDRAPRCPVCGRVV